MVEFMAIGTAVKKVKNVTTLHQDLPPQAIIQDRDTFFDTSDSKLDLDRGSASSSSRMQKGPLGILFFVFIVAFYIFKIFVH
jgi:hypothetical protein